jgi:isoleucyl-tRNA synthetase
MSKSKGNYLDPWTIFDTNGADAMRWYFCSANAPWVNTRFFQDAVGAAQREFMFKVLNVYSFFTIYANIDGFAPGDGVARFPGLTGDLKGGRLWRPAAERSEIDRWMVSETNLAAREVTKALDGYDVYGAAGRLSSLAESLSNWYVRRNRRRFWAGDPAALATLHECLYVVTLLMAPLVPFVTERVWGDLFASTSDELPESVHLAAWPRIDGSLVRDDLAEQMKLVRRLVELGRATRATSGVKTRQPLARALVAAPGWSELPDELRAQVADELNVLDVQSLARADGSDEAEPAGGVGQAPVDVLVKANFRALGKRFGKATPKVAAAVAAVDPRRIADELRETGSATVTLDGERIALGPDEVVVTETPREGWAVAAEGGETVALDLALTPALRRAVLAREVVRMIQEARKNAGLDVSDRIELIWATADRTELAEAIREHGALVADEVLATRFVEGSADSSKGPVGDGDGTQTDFFGHRDAESGLNFRFRRRVD